MERGVKHRPRRRSPLPFLLLAVAVVGCAFAVAVAAVVPMEADSHGGQDQALPTPMLDVLELYERVTPFGAPYIVAKAGFLLQAVIMPCDVISAQFVQRLQELTRQCAVSLDLREQERERQAAAESAGQFKVDPETGAIIEPESEAGDDD